MPSRQLSSDQTVCADLWEGWGGGLSSWLSVCSGQDPWESPHPLLGHVAGLCPWLLRASSWVTPGAGATLGWTPGCCVAVLAPVWPAGWWVVECGDYAGLAWPMKSARTWKNSSGIKGGLELTKNYIWFHEVFAIHIILPPTQDIISAVLVS